MVEEVKDWATSLYKSIGNIWIDNTLLNSSIELSVLRSRSETSQEAVKIKLNELADLPARTIFVIATDEDHAKFQRIAKNRSKSFFMGLWYITCCFGSFITLLGLVIFLVAK